MTGDVRREAPAGFGSTGAGAQGPQVAGQVPAIGAQGAHTWFGKWKVSESRRQELEQRLLSLERDRERERQAWHRSFEQTNERLAAVLLENQKLAFELAMLAGQLSQERS